MKSVLMAFALMFSVFSAHAVVEIDTRGLTDAQKAELVKQAELLKKQSSNPIESADKAVDKVDKWVDIGERLGKMLGGAAKEVGIAVNEFVKTPVGMMTAGLIVWNYMGSMIIHVTAGLFFFVTTFSILYMYSRRLRKVTIVYDKEQPRNWLGQYPVLRKEIGDMDNDTFGGLMTGYAVCFIVSLATMFSW